MENNYILQMENIQKEYFGNKVLKGVSLSIKPGEIHALLGENGAGKSTLMNILFGMSVIHSTGGFSGSIKSEGKELNISSPNQAMELGIGMVHQEFMLIPGFTVAENIKLNREITKPNPLSYVFGPKVRVLDVAAMKKESRASLDELGMNISENALVSGLPVGHMQFVEIAREIDKKNIKLLVFDEPTAVLTESEAQTLLKIMKEIAAKGIAIIFITHRLDEVIEVADNVTILRDGEMVAQMPKEQTNAKQLAELMVGRKIDHMVDATDDKRQKSGKTILEIKNLRVQMPGEQVKNVSLSIQEGEILGIGGLAGQGKIGISNGIMGLFPAEGEVYFEGEKMDLADTKNSLSRSIAIVSENRRGNGLLLDTSIEENIVMTALNIKHSYLKRVGPFRFLNRREMRKRSEEMIRELDIRCTSPQQITRRLSGGNQQKVCMARALTTGPKLLFVSEPTRGIDIGAKKILLEYLLKINREEGVTIVMTSSELAELRSVCDRVAIIYNGKVEGVLSPFDSDADYGLMMAGNYDKYKKEVE
ncbi:sugar ABC transporter ATP-binding protein [Hydrogenoanaerobacterium sp.]|uniref:sugar ABC transporter ATP-binding protein n=1 Tax=Hydrogenoanaerobacterium sp. TaxID=2953763 RepID=UPI002898D7BC|nr:sugar ABC transporter ATP-binding protein [Hydrogenoanaerobacterium sp.]